MKSTSLIDDGGMNIYLHEKLLKEIECFQYLGSLVAVHGSIDVKVKF